MLSKLTDRLNEYEAIIDDYDSENDIKRIKKAVVINKEISTKALISFIFKNHKNKLIEYLRIRNDITEDMFDGENITEDLLYSLDMDFNIVDEFLIDGIL